MNESRRQELRKRYRQLADDADRIMDTLDCGWTLAAHINPRLGEIERELAAIAAEVRAAMAEERRAQP